MSTADVIHNLYWKQLMIVDRRLDGTQQLRFPTFEEMEFCERGELENPFVFCPKVVAKDRHDLQAWLIEVGYFLERFGAFPIPLVIILPGRILAIVDGEHISAITLKPIQPTAAQKLKLQNEVVKEGGSVKWTRVPDDSGGARR
jgi:hypothetical protein